MWPSDIYTGNAKSQFCIQQQYFKGKKNILSSVTVNAIVKIIFDIYRANSQIFTCFYVFMQTWEIFFLFLDLHISLEKCNLPTIFQERDRPCSVFCSAISMKITWVRWAVKLWVLNFGGTYMQCVFSDLYTFLCNYAGMWKSFFFFFKFT